MTLRRAKLNPILTRADIPDIAPHLIDATSVFNPGATRLGSKIVLLLRVQARSRETYLVLAESNDGVKFGVDRHTLRLEGFEARVHEIVYHVYDPRITKIDGEYFVMLALDTDRGCRLGVAHSADLRRFEFLGVTGDEDLRNGVLFPERFDGAYMRLERPNRTRLPGGPATGDEIRLSISSNLIEWEPVGGVLHGRDHYWDELIGSGPPPLRTAEGWLHLYHGVARHFGQSNIYQAGAVLLDPDHPTRVKARTRCNILEPRESWELTGQVPNVVFPSGLVTRNPDPGEIVGIDEELLVYYGAADTAVGLASATVGELIDACHD
ncbi:MAG: hypothetical protein GY716_02765 [bacterium]|nr:hypothetical protein [bacterium]